MIVHDRPPSFQGPPPHMKLMDPGQYHAAYSYEQTFHPPYLTLPLSENYFDPCQYSYSPIVSPIPSNQIIRDTNQLLLSPSPFQQDSSYATAAFDISSSPSITLEEPNAVISISTTFHARRDPLPDTALSSSDGVLFFVHAPTLFNACPEVFRLYTHSSITDVIFRENLIMLDAPSAELNVILHALYDYSPAAHSPKFDILVAAVDRMPSFSISPENFVKPSTALYDLLLSYAPLLPLELYALGSHHNISALSVSVSSHLLAYDLSTITDVMAERIGAICLKKLLLLHVERVTALKDILLHAPYPHEETYECGFVEQRGLTRAWAVASAYLAWDGFPDLSTLRIQAALQAPLEDLTYSKCKLCRKALKDRIKDAVIKWASVKRTV